MVMNTSRSSPKALELSAVQQAGMQVGCDGVVHVIALSNYARYAGRIKRSLCVQDILTEAGDAESSANKGGTTSFMSPRPFGWRALFA